MIPVELVAFGSAVAGLLALIRSVERHATRRGLETVARELGLEAVALDGGILGRPRLIGIAQGFSVAVSEERAGRRVVTRIVVGRAGAIPFALELRAETLRSRLDAALGERDVATGDAAFDAAVLVKGDPGLVSGILTGEARAEAARLARAGVWVKGGQVAREVAGRMVPASELVGLVGESMRLAGLLFTPANLAGRLAANARKDPSAAVRRRNLELLADRHPDAPESGESLRRALRDPDPGLALWAALRLGEDGRATLRELVADARTPGAVAVGAAAALARDGDAAARDRLVAALADGDGDVRLAAAEALGEVGTAAAVTPLRAAIAGHPLDLAFRRAAATAIDAIQERATGAAPGQLALAGGEAGALALADAPDRGTVALAGEGGNGGDDGS
jgi:hypothetical protein